MKVETDVHDLIARNTGSPESDGARWTILSGIVLTVILLAATMLLGGCAGGLTNTLDVTEKGMVGLDIATDQSAATWEAYVKAQINTCREKDLPSAEAREKCLGPAAQAPKVERALERIVQAQGAMVEAITALREVAPVLEAARGK